MAIRGVLDRREGAARERVRTTAQGIAVDVISRDLGFVMSKVRRGCRNDNVLRRE